MKKVRTHTAHFEECRKNNGITRQQKGVPIAKSSVPFLPIPWNGDLAHLRVSGSSLPSKHVLNISGQCLLQVHIQIRKFRNNNLQKTGSSLESIQDMRW